MTGCIVISLVLIQMFTVKAGSIPVVILDYSFLHSHCGRGLGDIPCSPRTSEKSLVAGDRLDQLVPNVNQTAPMHHC